MISQIRIYTINKGEMDNFLKHFKDEIMVLHQKIGVPIVGTWVNRPQNEFIWVRTYKDKVELEAKTKEFQAAVAAAGVKLGANVAKMEVRRPNRRLRRSGFRRRFTGSGMSPGCRVKSSLIVCGSSLDELRAG